MKQITVKQYAKIHPFLPVQRGSVRISNITFINAVLSVLENCCMWRAPLERFGTTGSHLLKSWDDPVANAPLAMDRAYEGAETRQLVRDLGMTPVVPPKANRKIKWDYDRETYKFWNEVEQLF